MTDATEAADMCCAAFVKHLFGHPKQCRLVLASARHLALCEPTNNGQWPPLHRDYTLSHRQCVHTATVTVTAALPTVCVPLYGNRNST